MTMYTFVIVSHLDDLFQFWGEIQIHEFLGYMYGNKYIYVYIYMFMYVNVYVYIYICVYIHLYIVYMYMCVYIPQPLVPMVVIWCFPCTKMVVPIAEVKGEGSSRRAS